MRRHLYSLLLVSSVLFLSGCGAGKDKAEEEQTYKDRGQKDGKLEKTAEITGEAKPENPEGSMDTWNDKGIALSKEKKYPEAIECFDRAIALNANDPFAWNNKGVCLGKLLKYPEAIKCLEKALSINSDNLNAWYNLSFYNNKLGQYKEQLRCLDESLKRKEKDAVVWYDKAIVLNKLGRKSEALLACDKAAEVKPDGTIAKKALALKAEISAK